MKIQQNNRYNSVKFEALKILKTPKSSEYVGLLGMDDAKRD